MRFYIDCDLETAMKRIQIRGREMEQSVDENYWKRLNEKYVKWYSEYNLSDKLSIDANSYHPDNDSDIIRITSLMRSNVTDITH